MFQPFKTSTWHAHGKADNDCAEQIEWIFCDWKCNRIVFVMLNGHMNKFRGWCELCLCPMWCCTCFLSAPGAQKAGRVDERKVVLKRGLFYKFVDMVFRLSGENVRWMISRLVKNFDGITHFYASLGRGCCCFISSASFESAREERLHHGLCTTHCHSFALLQKYYCRSMVP